MAINNVLPSDVDFSKYLGQWVVIYKKKIIAHDKDINNLKDDINRCKLVPVIAKIPKKETLIF